MCLTVEDQTFGNKLRIARERHNLTRVQLAEQIGSSSKTIARWERDETLPRSQFHQKLCTILNTTPQGLGLETKIVEEKQRPSPIYQHRSAPTSPVIPSLDEPEKRSNRYIITGCGVCGNWEPPICKIIDESEIRHTLYIYFGYFSDAEENNQQTDIISDAGSKPSIWIMGGTGIGKSSLLNAIAGLHVQEKSFGATSVEEPTNGWKYPALNMLSPENIEKKASYGFFRGEIISLAYANREKYISYIAEHPITISQYTLLSTFCGIVLPTIFTTHLQVDIGGIATSTVNVMQIIHSALSDPAWQGFGVIISIVLPIIMGYKKKSFLVAPFSVPFALAA